MAKPPPARGGHAKPVHAKTIAGTPAKVGPNAKTIRDSQAVVIASVTPPKLSVSALLDATRPQPSAGYGGWSTLQRVRRRGVLEWDGGAPWQIQIPLILDNATGGDVEGDCDQLEEMAISPGPLQPPPLVDVTGPFSKATEAAVWVISDISWGTAIVLANGNRRQQWATVTLLQHAKELLARTATKAAKAASHATSPYRVKAKDTLDTIAADQLGSASRKSEIVAVNLSILGKDPRNLRQGMTIQIPVR